MVKRVPHTPQEVVSVNASGDSAMSHALSARFYILELTGAHDRLESLAKHLIMLRIAPSPRSRPVLLSWAPAHGRLWD